MSQWFYSAMRAAGLEVELLPLTFAISELS